MFAIGALFRYFSASAVENQNPLLMRRGSPRHAAATKWSDLVARSPNPKADNGPKEPTS